MSVVGQTASAFVVPGSVCEDSWMSVLAVASFKPAREGRLVTATFNGSPTADHTDVNGRVAIEHDADSATLGTKKVTIVADSFNGSAAKTTSATYKVVPCLN